MIGRAHHLHDDRLYECYLAKRTDEPLDPPTAEHLADCSACGARYAELSALFETVRDEGDREADDIFTAEQLQHQEAQILRRVDHIHHSGRVISFPGRADHPHDTNALTRVAPRWLAAAAAAGLFVGVAVGGMFSAHRDTPTHVSWSASALRPAPARLAPPSTIHTDTPVADDDAIDDDRFLRELEVALDRPHTRELQPFDALTPHMREIGSRVR
jgi:hypothetical protein